MVTAEMTRAGGGRNRRGLIRAAADFTGSGSGPRSVRLDLSVRSCAARSTRPSSSVPARPGHLNRAPLVNSTGELKGRSLYAQMQRARLDGADLSGAHRADLTGRAAGAAYRRQSRRRHESQSMGLMCRAQIANLERAVLRRRSLSRGLEFASLNCDPTNASLKGAAWAGKSHQGDEPADSSRQTSRRRGWLRRSVSRPPRTSTRPKIFSACCANELSFRHRSDGMPHPQRRDVSATYWTKDSGTR
jgi:hypothetical protein